MIVWLWVLKFFVFLFVFRIAQIAVWNFRKVFYVHPWVTDLIVTILAVIALVVFAEGSWWALVVIAILFGVIRGDQEHGTSPRRELM